MAIRTKEFNVNLPHGERERAKKKKKERHDNHTRKYSTPACLAIHIHGLFPF